MIALLALALAAPEGGMLVQGRVLTASGQPAAGTHTFTVTLDGTGGPWTSEPYVVTLDDGYYALLLGDAASPVPVPADAAVSIAVDSQAWGPERTLAAVPAATTVSATEWSGLTSVPAEWADGDDRRPSRADAGNWGFEDGPNGNLVGDAIPGWRITGTLDALDHTPAHAHTGGHGFGADSCCDPAAVTWSAWKYFVGNFDGRVVSVGIDAWAYQPTPDSGTCGGGQEWVGEDDARFWLYAYDAAGTLLDTSYSTRLSTALSGGAAYGDGWARVSHDWAVPTGTRIVAVEIFADDDNGTCQSAGHRGVANAGVMLDDFTFATDAGEETWAEVPQTLGL